MSKPIAEVKYRLGKAIDMKGKTQQELSNETGISKSSISQYIHGYSKPRPTNIVKLARALDVDPGWLTGFDVPMKKAEECLPIYEAAAGEGRIGDGSPCGEYRITIDQDHDSSPFSKLTCDKCRYGHPFLLRFLTDSIGYR